MFIYLHLLTCICFDLHLLFIVFMIINYHKITYIYIYIYICISCDVSWLPVAVVHHGLFFLASPYPFRRHGPNIQEICQILMDLRIQPRSLSEQDGFDRRRFVFATAWVGEGNGLGRATAWFSL